jgi:hypothetical protein
MKEFTFESYTRLINSFKKHNYSILPTINYVQKKDDNSVVVLRHDVDRYPNNALKMAKIEEELGIQSTYYFRIIPSVLKSDIIKRITNLGHEIGYHYEDLAKAKGNYNKAIISFQNNLKKLRQYYPVKTICMHGSPLSKWDNKKLWNHYAYKDFGIICDTSFDINYDAVFYISDNGFGWNKTSTSIRDKVKSKYNISIIDTRHLIELIEAKRLPLKIMLNAHPDTFFDFGLKWLLNYTFIKSKNIIKWCIVKTAVIR